MTPRALIRSGFVIASAVTFWLAAKADGAKSNMDTRQFEEMMKTVSNWGRWGKEDQLGALNLITPEKRRSALALAKEGLSISLSHNVIKDKVDVSPQFTHKMLETGQTPNGESSSDLYSVQYHGYTQTHLDALCHLFYKGKMYNGFSQQEVTNKGAQKLSVILAKNGIVTRGVLIDIPRLKGVKYLQGKQAIYPADLDAWEKKTSVHILPGDAVFIRTGRWARAQAEGAWVFEVNSAGLDASCVPWFRKRDIAVLASDLASDVMPSGSTAVKLPVHWLTIVAMGVPILDNCDLETLGDHADQQKRWAFLLTVAPLAVEGGTGSPVNPLAIF